MSVIENAEVVIIGGGIAGLCAAVRLTELGICPWIIEAGTYPSHKVCGEFISPQTIPTLHRWGIQLVDIPMVDFCTPNATLQMHFPFPAGSLSHLQLDPLLVQRAIDGGAVLKTRTEVIHLDPIHRLLTLSSGEKVYAQQLIIATGRYQQSRPKMLYKGIKAHFEGFSEKKLKMFAFKGAYLGISPIENGRFNVACLASHKRVGDDMEQFISELRKEHPHFNEYFAQGKRLFHEWMHISVPNFGVKEIPCWANTYFIGDAAATTPPATGNGLSMGIAGGLLVAEYVAKRDAEGFRRRWQRINKSHIAWGKALHHALLHPVACNAFIKLAQIFPSLPSKIFARTR